MSEKEETLVHYHELVRLTGLFEIYDDYDGVAKLVSTRMKSEPEHRDALLQFIQAVRKADCMESEPIVQTLLPEDGIRRIRIQNAQTYHDQNLLLTCKVQMGDGSWEDCSTRFLVNNDNFEAQGLGLGEREKRQVLVETRYSHPFLIIDKILGSDPEDSLVSPVALSGLPIMATPAFRKELDGEYHRKLMDGLLMATPAFRKELDGEYHRKLMDDLLELDSLLAVDGVLELLLLVLALGLLLLLVLR